MSTTMIAKRGGRLAGFALIELVVALAIAGLVLLGARAMLENVADAADRIAKKAQAADREANAERLLRALVGRIESATVTSHAVSGDAQQARFATWCDMPAGWQERCEVALRFGTVRDENALIAALPTRAIVVRRAFDAGKLLYLTDARDGGSWLPAWRSEITTPIALGVVLEGDTLILRIGERG